MRIKKLLAGILAVSMTVSMLGSDVALAASTPGMGEEAIVSYETIAEDETTVAETVEDETIVSEEELSSVEDTTEVISEENVTESEVETTVEEVVSEEATESTEEEITLIEESNDSIDAATAEYIASLNMVKSGSNLYVVGDDGIKYDNVTYLNINTLLSLPVDAREAYSNMVNDIAKGMSASMPLRRAVISTDAEGGLNCIIDSPYIDIDENFELPDAEDIVVFEEESAVIEEESETADVEDTESDESVSVIDDEAETMVSDEVASDTSLVVDDYVISKSDTVIVENEDLFNDMSPVIADVDNSDVVDIDSLFDVYNINYFYNQLNSTEKRIYNIAKSAMVNGGRNTISWNGSFTFSSEISSALSAVVTTYSSKFGWMDKSSSGGWSCTYRWSGGSYSYNLTLKKSSYHNSTLQKQANDKVKEVVNNAYAYAKTSTPNAPTYGIVKYIDNWLCANNYYDTARGVNGSKNTAAYYYCHSPYGCLVKGYGVCESYALALSWMLDTAGVPNMYCVSYNHAYVYVLMHDNKWYMVDSTWNDGSGGANTSSNGKYLLCPFDGDRSHISDGSIFGSSKTFKYPALSTTKYAMATEPLAMQGSTFYMKPGTAKAVKLTAACQKYYTHYRKTWTSSNTAVAKVSAAGKVTAVAPGIANISCTIAGRSVSKTIVVYKLNNMKFTANNKVNYTHVYSNNDTVINSSDVATITLKVNQAQPQPYNTAQLISMIGLAGPKAVSANPKVAAVQSISISGDTVTLKVEAKKLGATKINIKCAGLSAVLNFKVRQNIQTYQTSWFDYSKIVGREYAAKPFKPAVPKAKDANHKVIAPKNLTYKVTYANNKNAGTASVYITGTGLYTGTITKTFTISPLNISAGSRLTCTAAKVYNGAAQKSAVVVKKNGITLRNGIDYDVLYNGSTAIPANVGTYNITVRGKGNCTGTFAPAPAKTYTIKPIKIKNTTIVCSEKAKYTGSNVYPAKMQVKIGKNVLTAGRDYTISYEAYQKATGKWVPVAAPNAVGKYKVVFNAYGSNVIPNTPTNKCVKKAFAVVK